ncbi:hypothetical protein ES703_105552 [subsurface metagenome]
MTHKERLLFQNGGLERLLFELITDVNRNCQNVYTGCKDVHTGIQS